MIQDDRMIYQLIISLPMTVCLFWCIFFVIRAVRGEDEPRVKYTILLFYIASTVLYVNHWLFFSNHETTLGASLNHHLGGLEQSPLLLAARICFAVQVVWVWICGYRLLHATRSRMDNTYTDDRSYILQPTHTLLILIGITAVVSTLLNVLGRDLFDGSWLVYIPAVLMSILLFSLGYVAAHTTLPQETVSVEENHEEDKATTQETDDLMQKIATALREDKLFADSHLTIQDLATAVGSNRTYVSNCINRRTGLSFSQYVARYRVEYAKTILDDPQYPDDHETLAKAIAQSGFSSNQAFYRIFKEVTGITPLQYRHRNR